MRLPARSTDEAARMDSRVFLARALRVPGAAGPRAGGPRSRAPVALLAAVLCGLPAAASATEPAAGPATGAAQPAAPAPADPLEQAVNPAAAREARARELATLNQTIQLSAARQAELAREIGSLDKDARRLDEAMLKAADRSRALEKRLGETEGRIAELEKRADGVRAGFNARRATLAEILATLERIGRHPPPAIAVDAGDARRAVRSAMLLSAVMPQVRLEADDLAADLQDIARIERDVQTERRKLSEDARRLADERQRLALIGAEKRAARAESATELAAEQARAKELAARAGSLQDLIAGMEREALRRPAAPAGAAGARLAPGVAFAAQKGRLHLPVVGTVSGRFGEADSYGSPRQGMVVAAAPGAQVIAPADASVVYAGPFRSYGTILILNVGGGYHLLLAGLGRVDVDLGQSVLAGEPVAAVAGSGEGGANLAVKNEASPAKPQSALYIELRKDGAPVDPAPWWAADGEQEVRG